MHRIYERISRENIVRRDITELCVTLEKTLRNKKMAKVVGVI